MTVYLILVLAGFGLFMVTLATVWILDWTSAPKRIVTVAEARPAPQPTVQQKAA